MIAAFLPVVPFLGLTFAVSLGAFALIATVPGAQAPEGFPGLPIWLAAVWGPTLAAIVLSARDGHLGGLLERTIQFSAVPWEAWLMIAAPLFFLAFLAWMPGGEPHDGAGLPTIALLVAVNLILGPLGEELGWRGYMQERLTGDFGWLGASLAVGVVWFVWHLPLWTVASPQSEIPILLFGAHVMAYAVLIGAAQALSGGSLVPAILLHLTINVAAGWALFVGFPDAAQWFRVTLLPFWGAALAAAGYVTLWRPDGAVA